MAKKTKAEEPVETGETGETGRLKKLHERAVKRYAELEEYWAENRKLALSDIKFAAGDHWPENVKKQREDKGRPCLVFDKVSQYEKQIVNDGRQNRPSIKYRPVDDKSDIKVAEGFQGIARHVLTASNADEAFDTALQHAARSGFGYFRVLTDYAHDKAFEQDITIRRIRNPLSVLLAPHQSADGSDAEDGFVVDDMSKGEFERTYPNAEKRDWKADGKDYEDGWLSELTVRIAEYWYKEPVTTKLHLLADGSTATEDEYARDQRPDKPKIVRSRDVKDVKVKFCRLSGAEILEEREWAGRFIPIVPVYGEETDINGKVLYSGIWRKSRDAQLLYDYSRTAFAERVALAPKAPYVAAQGQVEGHPEWKTANTENHNVLPYTPQDVNGVLLPPPQRQQASDIPTGFAQDAQMSEHDIQAGIGMYAASVGAPSNEKSGKAIMARQREGDVATFHYHDNLNRAVRYLGRILLDLIPKVYDTKRVIRIVGEDGTVEMAQVNPELETSSAKIPGADGKPMPVFNLNAGRYDVDVSAGPSYSTKRQESADAMMEIANRNPAYWQTHGDLIAKSQDWPNAEEFAKRSMAILPPEIKAAIAEEEQKGEDGPSPEVMAIMDQAKRAVEERDQQIEQMGQMLEQAKAAVMDAQAKAAEAEEEAKEAEAKAIEAAGIAQRELEVKEREAKVKEADARTRRMEARARLAAAQAQPEGVEVGEEDADVPMEEDQIAQLVVAVQGIAARVEQIGDTVEALADYADAKPEVLRDENGDAYGVRKGGREMMIVRDETGKAVSLQ